MNKQIQIWILRYRYGHSIRRIAGITGIPKSTVHKRLKRRPAIFWNYYCPHQAARILGPHVHRVTHNFSPIIISTCQAKSRNNRETSNRKANLHINK